MYFLHATSTIKWDSLVDKLDKYTLFYKQRMYFSNKAIILDKIFDHFIDRDIYNFGKK